MALLFFWLLVPSGRVALVAAEQYQVACITATYLIEENVAILVCREKK